MIRPRHFSPNPATSIDNRFQSLDPTRSSQHLAADAHREVTAAAAALTAAGVKVHLFEDEDPARCDSVFPNNWFSTHAGGRVALYPMYSPSRRTERRADIVEELKATYRVQEVVDYSGLEHDEAYLEGTGAMVLDHVGRVAYAARSHRTNPIVLERFCAQFGYEPMLFDAYDEHGDAIYHTNVMMTVGTSFALVGLDLVADAARRMQIHDALGATGRTVISLSASQVSNFAGNAIELSTPSGGVLAISERAAASLDRTQREIIERTCTILPLAVPTIELAGGSVRCMIAGIHLAARSLPQRSARDMSLAAV
ncbi:citrulline utilization hydrolase CtlX [Janibacter melonis]|uniref:citrulline utilization hydrolase CtlX n=1 Tax=Janibacter melonis TaxID=262209 RepID=UPI001CD6E8F9|nr:arginine deiminase-related protein [Janibacter melonis]